MQDVNSPHVARALQNSTPMIIPQEFANRPVAWINGRFVDNATASLSVADLGIVQAAAVTEMLRTFGTKLFLVDEHLQRLRHALDLLGVLDRVDLEEIRRMLETVVAHNRPLIPATSDLGAILFVTAGMNPTYREMLAPETDLQQPTVGIHTFPLPLGHWKEIWMRGVSLAVSAIPQIPSSIIPPTIKCRNRLHWYLADQEANRAYLGSKAILLDQDGFLTETNSGNLFLVSNGVLKTPKAGKVLGGVSRAFVFRLCSELDIQVQEADLTPDELAGCDEAFLTSTSYCLISVTRFNNQSIGNAAPGPVWRKLVDVWSEAVGVDLHTQIREA